VALGHIDTIVMALGTNNMGDGSGPLTSKVNALLTEINVGGGSTTRVVWVGCGLYGVNNTNAAAANPPIKAAVEARPNSEWLNWNTFIHTPFDAADWIYPADSTHMTAAGYIKRDNYII
jgi:hypothetical protein